MKSQKALHFSCRINETVENMTEREREREREGERERSGSSLFSTDFRLYGINEK